MAQGKPISLSEIQTNGIFTTATNSFSGINGAQPEVTSTGQVSVPNSQAGNGIMSDLFNLGTTWLKNTYLSPKAPSVVTTPAAGIGGQQQLTAPLPGGITVVIPGINNPPVTTNTTSSSQGGTPSGWWMLPLLILAAFVFIPMLFKRRK